ncbi:MAG: diacylglycerol kinase family protein [Patescibacteria group bacterium]
MRKLKDSFKAAFSGFAETLIYERTFKIMFAAACLVIAGMFYFPTSRLEKIALLITIFSVLILELINSVIERMMNFIQPQKNTQVRIIKDLAAAVILLASFGAAIIGAVIFWPYLFK